VGKVWFVGKDKRLPAYELPFAQAVNLLELTKGDHVWSKGERIWPNTQREGHDFGLDQKTCVETINDELPGWKPGVYWARRCEVREADRRLSPVATKLNPSAIADWQ